MSDDQVEQENPPLQIGLTITASMEVTKAADIAKAAEQEGTDE